jgi:chromosome segregation ATPase
VERISEHHSKLQSEMKGLRFAIDALEEETKMHVDKLQLELEQTREKYDGKIAVVRVDVEKRTGELGRERDEKIEKIASANKSEVDRRLEEKKKLEQELVKLEQDKSEYEKRKDLRKHRKDEVGEARWEVRLREVKNQISTVKGKINALSDFISKSNKETEKTTKKTGDSYQRLIEGEEKKVKDLESLRDSEIGMAEREMEELRQETLAIADKIERLIDQKKKSSSTLEEATMKWKTEMPTLIHVPFYLIRYETAKEKRNRVRPPAIARAPGGLAMKIRKTLKGYSLQSKIGTLLKPRSKTLESMLASFEELLNRDKGLQGSLNQISAANNLLTSPDFKEKVRRGIDQLEAEGWVKPEEKTAILEVYAA